MGHCGTSKTIYSKKREGDPEENGEYLENNGVDPEEKERLSKNVDKAFDSQTLHSQILTVTAFTKRLQKSGG